MVGIKEVGIYLRKRKEREREINVQIEINSRYGGDRTLQN
jgi:hypothetical protein